MVCHHFAHEIVMLWVDAATQRPAPSVATAEGFGEFLPSREVVPRAVSGTIWTAIAWE